MTKEELAARLDGREYGNEMTPEEEQLAADNRLVAIFGYSDDGVEFRGAVYDEVCAFGGTKVLLSGDLLLPASMDASDEDVLERHGVLDYVKAMRKDAIRIDARWNHEGYPWWIEATWVDWAPFGILENGNRFCRGIVIDLKEIRR